MDEFARKETQPSLSDLLTLQSRVSIFHSYLRELEDLNARISATAGEGLNTTILVPTNRAVMALPRKPHLPADEKEDMPVISEQQAHKESQETLHRWIAAHFIPESPISFDATYPTLLDGVSVSFTKVDSTGAPSDYAVKVNDKADARIIDVKEAFNGVMYIIDGTIPVE
ncbi:hypothetical protein EXIGLDRAFT_605555 [Exidia glandulosa HHB12029]|uniref:FAS1 domain-containing protein n=1 Tax=Exidia glandulosa HHB12029 TaxID=1314781 RepID=A0A165MQS0_EXIGL|nr:hypothetical protein EXIGLDRAFT_605555 [Exidia glandulosa HHB12029]